MSKEFDLTTAKNLVDDLQKGERFYRAYKDAGVIATTVASLLQAEKDVFDRIEKAKKEEQAVVKAIDARLEIATQRAFEIAKENEDAAKKALAILNAANADAVDIVVNARAEADKIKEENKTSLKGTLKKIGDSEDKLAQIEAAIKLAQDEQVKIMAAVDNARNELKSMLG